jgi:hypothetical protein
MARWAVQFGFVAAAMLSGCSTVPEPVVLTPTALQRAVAYDDLGAVLNVVVTRTGRVDVKELTKASNVARLDAQLYRLSIVGPTASPSLLPTPEDRLAYWYNARTAWALKLALDASCPARMTADQLRSRPLPLDGREMTLDRIDEALADDGDWRATVAAPGIVFQRAVLPSRPFTAQDVRERMARRLNEFLANEEHFVIDVTRKTVVIPDVLWRLRADLIARHHARYGTAGATLATALLPHATGAAHRRLQDAVGYRCIAGGRGEHVALVGVECPLH